MRPISSKTCRGMTSTVPSRSEKLNSFRTKTTMMSCTVTASGLPGCQHRHACTQALTELEAQWESRQVTQLVSLAQGRSFAPHTECPEMYHSFSQLHAPAVGDISTIVWFSDTCNVPKNSVVQVFQQHLMAKYTETPVTRSS